MATARHLLESYRTDLFPFFPIVAIHARWTAETLRHEKPTLFLAVIAAAASKDSPVLSARLDHEVLANYAARTVVSSEKSLEILQALLISSVWYHPPAKYVQLKYYEYMQMAASMAMDLGIAKRASQVRGRLGQSSMAPPEEKEPRVHQAEDVSHPDLSMSSRPRDAILVSTADTESRRTFLACCIVCAGVALSLRRPNILRVTSYARECADCLAWYPDVLPTDRTLLAWFNLIVIGEDMSAALCYDDPDAVASITQLRTQVMLKDFASRLTAWHSQTSADVLIPSLRIMYHALRLYLHEIVLHLEHSPEDFRAPFQMGGLLSSFTAASVPTAVLATSLAELVSASHGLLDSFLRIPPATLRAAPVFTYVRISFAAFVLSKLCLSASHPEGRIGSVLDHETLKVQSYMDRSILHVREVVGDAECKIPAILLALLFKIRQWCATPEIIPPMKSLGQQRAVEETTLAPEPPAIQTGQESDSDLLAHEQTGGSSSSADTTARSLGSTPGAMVHSNDKDRETISDISEGLVPKGEGMQLDDDFAKYLEDLGDGSDIDDWLLSDDLLGVPGQQQLYDWHTGPSLSDETPT